MTFAGACKRADVMITVHILFVCGVAKRSSRSVLMALISLWTLFTWAVEHAIDTALSSVCPVLTFPLSHTAPPCRY